MPYEAKADKNCDHALTIAGLSHITKEIKVNVSYQSLLATIDPKSTEYLPMLLVESYGKIAENKRLEAGNFHEGIVKALAEDKKAKPYQINKSFQVYIIQEGKDKKPFKYMPLVSKEDFEANKIGPAKVVQASDKAIIETITEVS